MTADYRMDLDTTFHTPRIDVSGGEGVTTDRRLPAATRDALAREFSVIEGEATPLNMAFTIAGAVRRSGDTNEAATEPEIPWSEAVSEDEVG